MTPPIVIITGASGMLGQAVADRLAEEYTLVGLDVVNPPDGSRVDSMHYMDVTSDMSVESALGAIQEQYGDHLAAVVHLAAYYDFSGEESPLYDRVTVGGTRRLLEHLERFTLEQLVFSSTMLVHGPVKPGERIDEDVPLDPRWPYPKSKMKTERLIAGYRPTVPHVLLRIAGVYTEWGEQPTLAHQIKRIHERDFKSFFFPGDSDAGQSLVHVDDAARAVALSVQRREELANQAILIGEPDPLSYAELQDRIGELVWGQTWPTLRVPETVAKAGAWIEDATAEDGAFIKPFMIELADDHYALDISRARERLGWWPRHQLADWLPRIVRRLKDDPYAWYRANGLEAPEDMVVEAITG